MRKFILILTVVLLIICVNNSAQAASRFSVLPKVVNTVTKSLIKVGEDFCGFFWRNKVAITTGTVLVTAAMQPEPFISGAVAVASGPPVVVQSTGEAPGVSRHGYFVLAGLIGIVALLLMYKSGGRARIFAKIIAAGLLIGGVIFCCGIVRAGDFGLGTDITVCAVDKSIWWFLINLVLIILMGLPST